MRNQLGGGVLIAAGVLLGSIVGLMLGQTSAGMFGGLALGIVGAILVAVRESRKRGR